MTDRQVSGAAARLAIERVVTAGSGALDEPALRAAAVELDQLDRDATWSAWLAWVSELLVGLGDQAATFANMLPEPGSVVEAHGARVGAKLHALGIALAELLAALDASTSDR